MTDTTLEAKRILVDVFRRMSPGEKWLRLDDLYRDARAMHAAGVRLRNPLATLRDIHEAWLIDNLGFTHTELIREPPSVESLTSTLRELRDFLTIVQGMGIPYALGGSMASSIYGIDRHTRDADVTLEPFPLREAEFADSFGPAYYKDLPAICQAVQTRGSFNIINTSTGFKIDVFICKDEAFGQSAMNRRVAVSLPDKPQETIAVYSPEDIILFKLRWFRLGNEASDQQFKDALGVLAVQGDKLDQRYLDDWSAKLGLADLLARARRENAV